MKTIIIIISLILLLNLSIAGLINVPSQFPTIQAAINYAVDGDTVLVADGLYFENLVYNGKAITVGSYFIVDHDTSHIVNTILSGTDRSDLLYNSVVYFSRGEDSTSVLCGFTITAGTGSLLREWDARVGGAILLYYSGAKIINNIIENNNIHWSKAAFGGGIMVYGIERNEQVVIENNEIRENQVEGRWEAAGGAVFVYGIRGGVRVTKNKIYNNTVFSELEWAGGGAISCNSDLLQMERMKLKISDNYIFQNNTDSKFNKLYGGGGAVHAAAAAVEINNNEIYANSAPNGAGISIENGSQVQILNTIIRDNKASQSGGGIYIQYASAVMQNSTVRNNYDPENSEIYTHNGFIDVQNSKSLSSYNNPGNSDGYTLLRDKEIEPGEDNSFDLKYYLYIPDNYDNARKYPLIVYFCNTGSEGLDVTVLNCSFNEKESYPLFELVYNSQQYGGASFIVVIKVPFETLLLGDTSPLITKFLVFLQRIYSIDADRIYALGMSAGAHAAYDLVINNPNLFAAMVAIDGHYLFDPEGTSPNQWQKQIRHVPLWLYHGTKDERVSVEFSRNMFRAIKSSGRKAIYSSEPDADPFAKTIETDQKLLYSEIDKIGHFNTRMIFENTAFFKWLFTQHRPYINPYNVRVSLLYTKPQLNTPLLTTQFANRLNHNFSAFATIYNADSSYFQSISIYDNGLQGDLDAGDGIWSNALKAISREDEYQVGITITDTDSNETYNFRDMARFTSIGPLVFAGDTIISSDQEINPGDYLKFRFKLRNEGLHAVAKNVSVKVISLDDYSSLDIHPRIEFGDINPGETVLSKQSQYIRFSDNFEEGQPFHFALEISSNGHHFWTDNNVVLNTQDNINTINPHYVREYSLKQNYPNPFNPSTSIEFILPRREHVRLTVFNTLGQEVANIVAQELNQGTHKYSWDGSQYASGMYYYQLQAGNFQQIKRMILVK